MKLAHLSAAVVAFSLFLFAGGVAQAEYLASYDGNDSETNSDLIAAIKSYEGVTTETFTLVNLGRWNTDENGGDPGGTNIFGPDSNDDTISLDYDGDGSEFYSGTITRTSYTVQYDGMTFNNKYFVVKDGSVEFPPDSGEFIAWSLYQFNDPDDNDPEDSLLNESFYQNGDPLDGKGISHVTAYGFKIEGPGGVGGPGVIPEPGTVTVWSILGLLGLMVWGRCGRSRRDS